MRISRVTAKPEMRHHPPHLAVAPLAQAHGEPGILPLARVEPRLDRAIGDAVDGDALRQCGQPAVVRRAVHPHAVAPEPAGRGQLQPAGQRAVVGQQQQALAGEVKPADADHARQLGRQPLEHRGAALRVAMRGHQADRLVVAPKPRALRHRDHVPVHHHEVASSNEGGGMRDDLVVEPHLALGHQLLGIAPARHPGARQPLGDTFPLFAACLRHDGGIAHKRQAAISASKMRRSPGSMKNSGCHCTPRQKRWRVSSMPSITRSGETAFTTACGPGSRTAW